MYKIEIKKSAKKQLAKVPDSHRQAIADKINSLANEPIPANATALTGYENVYRFRHSTYRIVYQVKDDVLIVEIIRIAHRKEAYKHLDI
ncbi:MAG: type II toxin-antitoxin system RelE/ParE family toxin [Candidatus Caenarcaniphilales bacterium]|nr:type II toxin-antitoxin system RelE/ParE family toxin [Candidatus Caenarcaniphilales bacterium]